MAKKKKKRKNALRQKVKWTYDTNGLCFHKHAKTCVLKIKIMLKIPIINSFCWNFNLKQPQHSN